MRSEAFHAETIIFTPTVILENASSNWRLAGNIIPVQGGYLPWASGELVKEFLCFLE
jgi:hypothetical protein